MSVLEVETLVRTLPFPAKVAELLDCSDLTSDNEAGLSCPNILALEVPAHAQAAGFVRCMAAALAAENAEDFNEARTALLQLLRKQQAPVAQWNPLVLLFDDPDFLRGRSLAQLDFNMTRLATRKPGASISLEGACLETASFLCADLSGVKLAGAELTGADLRFANLAEADLRGAVLIEAKLGQARLTGASLKQANLYCANLSEAALRHAVLDEANLRKAVLRGADACKASFRFARMQQADLRQGSFLMADLSGAKLRYADLRQAYFGFARLREARFLNARIEETDFSAADLMLADFEKCRLSSVRFGRAALTGASLQSAELSDVCLRECVALTSANLQNARYDDLTGFPAGFKPERHGMQGQPFRGLRRWMQRMRAGFKSAPTLTTR